MAPRLSVIVPVYNVEKFLHKCVTSILNQTYKDFELILVDDASKDSSGEICDSYAEKYSFVKSIHNEHKGPLYTRKTGFLNASGEYISYIDGDDYIDPYMYEYMMKKITEYDADICACDIMLEFENQKIPLHRSIPGGYYDRKMMEKEVYPYMLFFPKSNLPGFSPSLCNKIIRRSVLEKVIIETNEKIYYGEDAVCSYPCMLDAESLYVTKDKFFYIYRQTKNSMSRDYDRHLMKKLPILIDILDKEFEKRNFDGRMQVNCYAVLQLIFCIRNELLLNKEKHLHQKIKELKKYISSPRFKEAIGNAGKKITDKQLKFKVFLLKTRQLRLLYILFYIKEKILLLRRCDNEKTEQ